MLCPRREEMPPQKYWPEEDSYKPTCSFCGSVDPDKFMDMLEKGHLLLGSTDKNYKVYVQNRSDIPGDVANRLGPNEIKFYFQHLSQAQQTRFIELWNQDRTEKKLFQFQGDYSFYVMPFFMVLKQD